jgi:hypothetical protein
MVKLPDTSLDEYDPVQFEEPSKPKRVTARNILYSVLALLPVIVLASYYRKGVSPVVTLHEVWSSMGLSTKVELPPCEKTMLFLFCGPRFCPNARFGAYELRSWHKRLRVDHGDLCSDCSLGKEA